jgi:aminoglycoside N3'-acetyltransferase
MTRFSKLIVVDGKPVETEVREINPRCCPHFILVADHYSEDGSCRCNDVTHTEMRGWGYKWSVKRSQWIG